MDNYPDYLKITQNRRLGNRINPLLDKYKDNTLKFQNSKDTMLYKKINPQFKKSYQTYNQSIPYRNPNPSTRSPYYNKYTYSHRIFEEENPDYRNNITAYDNIPNNSTISSPYELIDDFRNTYKKSQMIRSRILNQSNNYDVPNYRYDTENIPPAPRRRYPPGTIYLENKKKRKKTEPMYLNQTSIRRKYGKDILEDNGEEDNDMKKLFNDYSMNDMGQRRFGRNRKTPDVKNIKINENLNADNYGNEIDNGMDENSKLNESLNILIKSNQELRKDNRIMEEEIKNYKNQTKSFVLKDINNFNPENQSSKGFLKSFKQSIYANCKILDVILNTKKINDKNSTKITNLYEKNKFLFKKIENNNRRNAEIQISNEENEQKMNQLEEEKNNLITELEKLKLTDSELKNREKNLNLLNDSNKKALQDNEEHIFKLKNTINQLNKEKNVFSKNYGNNLVNTNENGIDISLYDNKIHELNSDYESLLLHKNELTSHQDNLQKILLYQTPMTPITNKTKLKQELDLIKKENLSKKQNLKKKENQIQLLKRCIDKLSVAIKSNNPQENIKRIGIENIIKDIEKDNKIEEMSEIQNLNMQIKLAFQNNANKNNELNQVNANLSNEVMQRDLIINELEQKLKIQIQNNNFNNYNNRIISNNNINNNNFNQMNYINQQNLQNYNMQDNNNFDPNMDFNQIDVNNNFDEGRRTSINELSLDHSDNNLYNMPANNLNQNNFEMNPEQFNQFENWENNFPENENEEEMGYDHEIYDQNENDIKDLDSVSDTGKRDIIEDNNMNNMNMYNNNNEMMEQYPENNEGYEEEYLNQGQGPIPEEGEEYEDQNNNLHNHELEQINEKNTNEEFDVDNGVNDNNDNNNNGEEQLSDANNNNNHTEEENKNENHNEGNENEYEIDINNMNALQNIENLNNNEQENNDVNRNIIHSLNEEELGQKQEQDEMQGHDMGDINEEEVEYDLNNHEQFNNMDENIDGYNNGYMGEMQNMEDMGNINMEGMNGLEGEEEMQNMEGIQGLEDEEEMQMQNMDGMDNTEGM